MTSSAKEPAQAEAFGPFVLERRIAVGGSAEVFAARPKLGTVPAPRLVVKRLTASARNSGDFDALEREATLHRAVDHPNVVKVFGAGMVGDEPYLAMEYVDGVDLYRLLRFVETEPPRLLPPELAIHITRQVARALGAVHAAQDAEGTPLQIVHCDVSPSNIYLSVRGEVKLGDFGIARFEQRRRVQSSEKSSGLKGKFGYLAPEQVAAEPFDHRADLFALTALLGEMLIGERVFPGSGQLAVLLAIREADIEPLRRQKSRLDPGLFAVCEQGLRRDPDDRFATALDLERALLPFESLPQRVLTHELAEWVQKAQDAAGFARKLERRVRDSRQRLQSAAVSSLPPVIPPPPSEDTSSRVRRRNGTAIERVPFAALIEMIVTGELGANDEVALWGDPEFRQICEITELARHLLPSTTATTGRLFEPGVPDYQAALHETSMLDVLSLLRARRETGALFIERPLAAAAAPQRKEVYLKKGRLLHVAAAARDDLLGEYLVRSGRLERADLDRALATFQQFSGHLGDTLVNLGLVDPVDVFRAIRDQGRDRVAALCGATEGVATFYRNTAPGHVEFPLDLDLASPMMAGCLVASKGEPRALLPEETTRVVPGPRAAALHEPGERGTAPASLQFVPVLAEARPSLAQALVELVQHRSAPEARAISAKEACAALIIAQKLGWIRFEP